MQLNSYGFPISCNMSTYNSFYPLHNIIIALTWANLLRTLQYINTIINNWGRKGIKQLYMDQNNKPRGTTMQTFFVVVDFSKNMLCLANELWKRECLGYTYITEEVHKKSHNNFSLKETTTICQWHLNENQSLLYLKMMDYNYKTTNYTYEEI